VRLVDTAGFEGSKQLDDSLLSKRSLNKAMVHDMLRQTRNALIYADLALFLLDTRSGINFNDVALYKWLTENEMSIKDEKSSKKKNKASAVRETEESNTFDINSFKDDTSAFKSTMNGERESMEVGKLPGMQMLDSRTRKRRKTQLKQAERELQIEKMQRESGSVF
jgi:hypothetical protein